MTTYWLMATNWRRLANELPDTNDGNQLFRKIYRTANRFDPGEDVAIVLSDHETGLIGYAKLYTEGRLRDYSRTGI